jgi:assimilatory nitrate reductase catalytic subunit
MNQHKTGIDPQNTLLRQWKGPLTRDLVLSPGKFGLGQVPGKLIPTQTTSMTCGFCSTGCSLQIHLREGEAINLSPNPLYPVNLGMACPKGWEALNVLRSDDRAVTPLLKGSNGTMTSIDWPTALTTFCSRFKSIIDRHGPESVAFLSSGQITTEEMLLLGCLTKFGMGWLHGDSNTRQCMATAAVAYKQAFGFDAPPYTYADFEESDLVVFVGANPCIGHPIMWERVLRNRRGARIVVIDPRRTETAQAAHLHLPIQPKSDQTLFYGIARELIERGQTNTAFIAAHTNGMPEFAKFVQDFPIDRVLTETGLTREQFDTLLGWIQSSERVSFWWTMGVNQSYQGVRTAQSLINLALLTGNIGRPGTGANSITGQCNAMGSRLYSNTSGLVGGRDFTNVTHRLEVARILGINESLIPAVNSLTYDQILDRVRAGKIRGLWVIGTNPAHSWIQSNEIESTFKQLEFLAVQDMYTSTETARHAHLLLPAAGWGEKDGTLINSERRLGVIKRVARAPGEALADFHIFRLIAQQWGCGDMFEKWNHPADAFDIMKQLSRGRPCDITAIANYAQINAAGGIQWPYAENQTDNAAERRLFADGQFFHDDHRARFLYDSPHTMPEPPCQDYPFVLLTGRGTVAQWHTQTRTGKSPLLRKLYPASIYVEIHKHDALRLSILPGAKVRVTSRRGSVVATAFITPAVQSGQLFIPMHYPETNVLTLGHYDPHSRQPSYKDCAVNLEPVVGGKS